MPRLGISEILSRVSTEEDIDKKVEILRKNDSPVLRGVLEQAIGRAPKWLLPPGKPPFNRNIYPGQQGNLYAEWRRMYLFKPGGNVNLTPLKRETIFIQILECLDPADADLLCEIKERKMPYKGVTKAVVEKAFPGIFPKVPTAEELKASDG